MKILFGIHHFPPKYNGGAEWRAYRTAFALQRRGYQVKVVCVENIDQTYNGGSLSFTDNYFQSINVRRLSFNLNSASDLFHGQYDNPWVGDHFKNIFIEDPPDIFHLFSGYLLTASTLEAAIRNRIPTIVSLTDFWFICPRITKIRSDGNLSPIPTNAENCTRCLGEQKRRYRYIDKFMPKIMGYYWKRQQKSIQKMESRRSFLINILNQTDQIISPSNFLREVHISEGINPNLIIYSRQGYDLPEYSFEKKLHKQALPIKIGYVGQISEHKGVHILLLAVRKLTGLPFSVHVYGDLKPFPQYTRKLKEIAKGDNRIVFENAFTRSELSKVLSNLDIIVVPSLWYENSPNTILEAFAHKIPVIASNLGGMAELVEHLKSGLLFEPGDINSLAEALKLLVLKKDLIEELRSRIPKIKCVATEIDELEDIYKGILERRSYFQEK